MCLVSYLVPVDNDQPLISFQNWPKNCRRVFAAIDLVAFGSLYELVKS